MTLEREPTPEQDPLAPAVPPVGEEIHLPGPSVQPLLVAVGTTIALVGLTMSWIAVAVGCVIVVGTVARWIGDTRREMAELPLQGDH